MAKIHVEIFKNTYIHLYLKWDRSVEIKSEESSEANPTTRVNNDWLSVFKSYVPSLRNVEPEIDAIFQNIIDDASENNSNEDWIDFMLKCGQKAKETQGKKLTASTQSRSCDILLAFRDYVAHQKFDEPEFVKLLTLRCEKLQAVVEQANTRIKEMMTKTKDITPIKANRDDALFQLALLSDTISNRHVRQQAENFGVLAHLQTIVAREEQLKSGRSSLRNFPHHPNLPYLLQTVCDEQPQNRVSVFRVLYQDMYQKHTTIDFDRFLEFKGDVPLALKTVTNNSMPSSSKGDMPQKSTVPSITTSFDPLALDFAKLQVAPDRIEKTDSPARQEGSPQKPDTFFTNPRPANPATLGLLKPAARPVTPPRPATPLPNDAEEEDIHLTDFIRHANGPKG